MMNGEQLKEKADAIRRMAEQNGCGDDFFFTTTFDRYLVQLRILEDLEKAINEEGMLVSKEYVKGRKNLYTNPAVSDFNRTTDSANKTVSTLIRIIKSFGTGTKEEDDPLMDIINE
jgi:hypothetical protein